MAEGDDAQAAGERVETLIAELRSQAGPQAAATAEELVSCLVELYGTGLATTWPARVRRAVEEVLPQLGSHAGDVEYLGLDDTGVLRLRLEQRGCSADTVRDLISKAVAAAAPEAAGVDIELVQPPAEPTLLQITRRPVGIQGTR